MSLMQTVIITSTGILLLSGLGFILGICLALLGKYFQTGKNPKIEELLKALPGINCGVCGYAGCIGYAEALVKNTADINICTPGADEAADKLNKILDKNNKVKLKYVAKVFCLGDDAIALKEYIFNGEDDCSTVYNFFQGDKACKYSCVARGNCMKICPVNAIKRDDYNRVWIDANICIGCEKCLLICPSKVIQMVPSNGGYFVACSSHETGELVKEICKKGCISCKICEKASSTIRIKVINNLAEVNYNNNDYDLYQAAVKCPADVIVPIVNQTYFMMDNKKNKKEFELSV